ncbi:MAG: isochorismate synthase MenF [Leptolyngbyaceae cyanobacterium]
MTVAPSRSNALPQYQTVLRALKACLRQCHQTNTSGIFSLAFPLPSIDPLAALLTLAKADQRQCYWESPSRGQAIAAWEALLVQEFSGSDRFQRARDCLTRWQSRVECAPSLQEGPYFFCSFSFFDTLASATEGFAPATVLLTRWQIVRQKQRCTLVANVLIKPHNSLAPLALAITEQLDKLRTTAAIDPLPDLHPWQPQFQIQLSPADAQTLQKKVQQTLQSIQRNQLQKQVVAHALDVTRNQAFRRSVALPRLRSRHPDCYVFSFSDARNAHFIGASPERLLSIRQGRLVTDALAGSAPRGMTAAADQAIGQQLLNTSKEQREHQLVLEFVVQQLRAKGLAPRYSTPPGLLRLSHIQHLHTPIGADLPAHISPLTLVEALHPTPAVAGVPTAMACDFIRRGEPCDRGLYAAPLGWVDPQGNSEFIVGIRSALIRGNRARLYAGAGIVSGSDPQKELAEIQLKLQALAEALG